MAGKRGKEMKYGYIKIGKIYKMKCYDTRGPFLILKSGSKVKVLEKSDKLYKNNIKVQDLSNNKLLDGIWWTNHLNLEKEVEK